ncbi:hyaluronidase-like isoform X1 [Athalia rosae]|uniref:hyaluronidase-like isoform X1 n=2 Tax=Athalia rosae TaxID=37344 RepID=UPI00203498CB|nr:hyaluronidase-like isoform X1 [Athalia rosae]
MSLKKNPDAEFCEEVHRNTMNKGGGDLCSAMRRKKLKFFVFVGVCIAVSNSPLFGLIQVPGASGATNHGFNLYWNVPTFMCHKYGMFFEDVNTFGIRQNGKDEFRGNEIAILYDPGVFPALLKDEHGRTVRRNGGVPQEGNLTYHLEVFRAHVNEQISDVNFAGVAVIDFESWRPIFRQNWAALAPYRDLSTEIERDRHPFWDKNKVAHEATRRFEKAARLFMEDTLKLARILRPKASWGYYAYPYCFNSTPNVPTAQCDPKVYAENDRLSWMFNLQGMLLPSVYIRSSLNKRERMELISCRVKEAMRISSKLKQALPKTVLPYFWYKYQDKTDDFLTSEDLSNGFRLIKSIGGDGIVIWGSSNDFNTKQKCQEFRDYLSETLGPTAWKLLVGRSRNVSETEELHDAYETLQVTTVPNVYGVREEGRPKSTNVAGDDPDVSIERD